MLDSIYQMTLILHFWRENIKILPSFTQHYNKSLRNVIKCVSHLWFIVFIAWHYITSRRDIVIIHVTIYLQSSCFICINFIIY